MSLPVISSHFMLVDGFGDEVYLGCSCLGSQIINSVHLNMNSQFQFNAKSSSTFFQVSGEGVFNDKPGPKMRKSFDNGFIAEVIVRLLLLGLFL